MQQPRANLYCKVQKLRKKTKQKMASSIKHLIKNQTYFNEIEKTIQDYQGHHSLQINIDSPNQKVSKALKQYCQQIKGVYVRETASDIEIKNLQNQIEMLEFYGKICHLNYLIEKKILQAIIWPKVYSLTWDDIYNLTNHIIKWSVSLKQYLEYLPGNSKVITPLELQEIYKKLKKPIDSGKLWTYLNKKNVKYQKYKQVVLLIGRTGAGKTTFIKSMLGYKHQGKHDPQDDVWTLQTTTPLKEVHKQLVAKISAVSVTSDINVVKLRCGQKGTQILLVDCPGLNDTRGGEVQLANNCLRDVFLKSCQKIIVIQMVKINDLLTDRVNSVRYYAQYLKKQYNFNDQEELASHLILLYNYSDSDKAAELNSLIEQKLIIENDSQLTSAYKFMKNQLSQVCYHIRKKNLGDSRNDQQDFQQIQSKRILRVILSKIYVETNMLIKNFIKRQEQHNLLETIILQKEKMQYYLNLKKIKEAKYQLMIIKQLFKCFRDPQLLLTYERTFIDILKGFYFEAVSNLQSEDKNLYFTQEQFQQIKKFNFLIKEIRYTCCEIRDLKQKNEDYKDKVNVFLQALSELIINKDKLDQNEIIYLQKYSSELQNDTYKHFVNSCIQRLEDGTSKIEKAINLLAPSIDFARQLEQIQRLISNLKQDEIIVDNLSNHSLAKRFSIQSMQQLELKLQTFVKLMAKDLLIYRSHVDQQLRNNFQQYYYIDFKQKSIQVLESFTIFREVIPQHKNISSLIKINDLEQKIVDFFKTIAGLYKQFSKFIQKLQSNEYDLVKAKVIAVNFKKDMSQIFKFDLIKNLYPTQLIHEKEKISSKCQAKYNEIKVLNTMILNLIKNKGIEADLLEIKKHLENVAKFIKCKEFYRYYLQINQNDDFQVQLEGSLSQKYGQLYQQQQSPKNVNRLLNLYVEINNIGLVIASIGVNNQITAKIQQLLGTIINKIRNVKVFILERLKKYRDQLKVLSQQINPEEIVNIIKYICEIIKQDQRHQNCKEIQILKNEFELQFTGFLGFFEENLNGIKLSSIFDRDIFNEIQNTKQINFLCRIIEICAKLKSVELISSNKNYDIKSNTQFIQKIIKAANHKFTVLNAQFQEERTRSKKSKNSSDLLKKMMTDLNIYNEISYYMEKYFQEIAKAQGGICQTVSKIRLKIRESIQSQSMTQQTQVQELFKNFLTTEFFQLRFINLWKKIAKTQKRMFFVNEFESYIDHLIKKNRKQKRFKRITEENAKQLQLVLNNAEDIHDISQRTKQKLKSQILQQRGQIECKLNQLLKQIKSLVQQQQFQKAHDLCNLAYKSLNLLQGLPISKELINLKQLIMAKEQNIQKKFEQIKGDQSITPHKIAMLKEEDQKIHIYLIGKKSHFANKIRLNFKKHIELLVDRFERQQIPISEFIKLLRIYQKFYEYSRHAFDGLRISQFFAIKQTLQNKFQTKLSYYLNIFIRQLTNRNNDFQRQDFLMMENNFQILQFSQLYPQIPEYRRIKDFIKKIFQESILQMINCQDLEQKIRMIQRLKAKIKKTNNKQLSLMRDVSKEIQENVQKHYSSTVLNIIHEMEKDFDKIYIEKFKLTIIKDFLVTKKQQYKDVYLQLGDHLKKYSSICTQYLVVQKYLSCLPQEYMNLGSQIQQEFRLCYNYQQLKETIGNLYQSTPKEQKARTQLFVQQVKKIIQKVQRLSFEGKDLLYINRKSFINRQTQQSYVLSLKKDFLLLKVIYKKINQNSPLYSHFQRADILSKFMTSLFNKIKSQVQKFTKQMEAIIFSDDTKQTKQRSVCLVPYFQIKRNLLNLFIQRFKELKSKQSSFYKEGSNEQKQFINKRLAERQILQQIYLMKKLSIFKPQLMIEKQSEIKSHLKKEQTVEAIKKSFSKERKEQRKFILYKIFSQNSSFEYHTGNIQRFLSYQNNRMDEIKIQIYKQYLWSLSDLVKKSPTLEIFSLKKYYEQKCGVYQETSIILSIFSYIFPAVLFSENYPFITYLLEIKNTNNKFNMQQFQKVVIKISNSQKQTLKMFISLYFMLNNYDLYVFCDSNSMLFQKQQRMSIFLSKNMENQQRFQVFKDFQTFLSKRKQILAHRKSQKQRRKQIIVVQAQRILNLLLDNHTKNKKDLIEHLQHFHLYAVLCIIPYGVIYEPIKKIYPEIRILEKQTTKKQNYQFSLEPTKDIQYLPVVNQILISKTKRNNNVIICFQNSQQLQLFLEKHSHLLPQHYQSFVIIDEKQDESYVRELKFQTMDIFVNILLTTKEMFLRLKKSKHLSINEKEIQFILTYVPEFSISLNEIRSTLNSISSKSTLRIVINKQQEKKINIKKGQTLEVSTVNQYMQTKQKEAFNEVFNQNKDFLKTKAKNV